MLLIAIVSVSAEDPLNIIPEGDLTIQKISTQAYRTWPGTTGFGPVEVSASAGRIWLIWPRTLISLTSEGDSDTDTILGMFASATADWGGNPWTPENGILCSDGNWRGFSGDRTAFLELDSQSGEVDRTPWLYPPPQSIRPGSDGDVWTFLSDDIVIIEPTDDTDTGAEIRSLDTDPPTAAGWAVSKTGSLAAWIGALDGSLSSVRLDIDYRFDSFRKHQLTGISGTPPWGITWAGNKMVLSYSGQLTMISVDGDTGGMIRQFKHPQIPGRWYRIIGGGDFLLIHSPESGDVTVLGLNPGRTGSGTPDAGNFTDLLRTRTLEAGDRLESSGRPDSAEKFYGWALPLVRAARSQQPMDDFWPFLEAELNRRRSLLRENY